MRRMPSGLRRKRIWPLSWTLPGWARVAEAGTAFHLEAFRFFRPTAPSPDQVNEFLSRHLETPAKAEAFLPDLFEALKQYRRRRRSGSTQRGPPTGKSLRPFLDPGRPERWLQAVGVPKDIGVW